jgi:hypothetical protein
MEQLQYHLELYSLETRLPILESRLNFRLSRVKIFVRLQIDECSFEEPLHICLR